MLVYKNIFLKKKEFKQQRNIRSEIVYYDQRRDSKKRVIENDAGRDRCTIFVCWLALLASRSMQKMMYVLFTSSAVGFPRLHSSIRICRTFTDKCTGSVYSVPFSLVIKLFSKQTLSVDDLAIICRTHFI